jgi:sporulation protein YlmC with PRC-barrel domain
LGLVAGSNDFYQRFSKLYNKAIYEIHGIEVGKNEKNSFDLIEENSDLT